MSANVNPVDPKATAQAFYRKLSEHPAALREMFKHRDGIVGAENVALQAKAKHLKDLYESALADCSRLNDERTKIQRECKKLEEKIKSTDRQIAKLDASEVELTRMRREQAAMKKAAEENVAYVGHLKKEIEKYESAIRAWKDYHDRATKYMDDLKASARNAKTSAEKAVTDAKTSAELRITTMRDMYQKRFENLLHCEQRMHDAQKLSSSLRGEIDRLRDERHKLRQENNELKKSARHYDDRVNDIDGLTRDLDKVKNQRNDVQRHLRDAIRERDQLRDQLRAQVRGTIRSGTTVNHRGVKRKVTKVLNSYVLNGVRRPVRDDSIQVVDDDTDMSSSEESDSSDTSSDDSWGEQSEDTSDEIRMPPRKRRCMMRID